jgi:limonene-1,2-epoxide hydrolase
VLHISASGGVVLTERVDKFLGPKNVELPVMGAFEIKDGEITAWRDYFDLGAWTKQMGAP